MLDYDLVGYCVACHKNIANFTERGTFDGFNDDANDIYFVLSNHSRMHSKICTECLVNLNESDYPKIMECVIKGWHEELARNGVTKAESDRYMLTYKNVSILSVYDDTLIMGGGTITLPNTFTAGTTIQSAQVNSNFTTIYNDYANNITNVNIASGAAIANSKLNLSSIAQAITMTGGLTITTQPLTATAGLTTSGNYPIEGLSTGRCVLRQIFFQVAAGGTPGTNITTSTAVDAGNAFNAADITNATNLAKNNTSGSIAFSADGTTLTITMPQTVVGIIGATILKHQVKNASTTAGDIFFAAVSQSSGKILLSFRKTGSLSNQDITTILTTAGDTLAINLAYISST